MATVDLLQRIRDLTDRRLRAGGVDGQCHQVVAQSVSPGPVATGTARCRCGPGQFGQCRLHGRLVALGAQLLQLGDLFGADPAVLDLEHLDVGVLDHLVLVHPDHRLLTGVDAGLGAGGGLFDAKLRDSVADRLGHTAALGHLGDVRAGPLGELMRQPLHVVGAAPRVDRPGGAGLLLQQQLGVACDAGGEVGGQRQRLVECVGVQRLGVTLGGGHRLDTGARHIVERILGGERPARGLRMSAQGQRFGALRPESGDQLAPQQPAGPEFGHLHEEVHPDAPEEGQSRGELVDVQAGIEARLDVVHTVGQRVGQLEIGCGTGFLDVIARDRDGVELRHLHAGVGEDVGDDPHRGLRRIDVGVAHHELFEDVVLDGAGQLLRRNALLLGGHHVERQDRQHRTVHGHRDRHRRQVDTVEKLAHVQDRVDRHAGHTDVALHPRVVGVVAAVGGQIEGHRQAFLPGCEVATVEGVGVRRGGEAGVLTDGPRLVHVHRGIGPADERRLAGEAVHRVARGRGASPIRFDVQRFDDYALGGLPVQLLGRIAVGCGRLCDALCGGGLTGRGCLCFAAQRNAGEIRNGGDT